MDIGPGNPQLLHDETIAPRLSELGITRIQSHRWQLIARLALERFETIRAVVEAYGRGEIELEAVDPKTNKAQIHALPGGNAYSLHTVARFLGWTKPSDGQATHACRIAFDAYPAWKSFPRGNIDKHRCVEIALKEFPEWSDRKIADVCGVSDSLVFNTRKEIELLLKSTPQPQTRTGRDGKQYPAKK